MQMANQFIGESATPNGQINSWYEDNSATAVELEITFKDGAAVNAVGCRPFFTFNGKGIRLTMTGIWAVNWQNFAPYFISYFSLQ